MSAGAQGEVETAGVWKHFPHDPWPINYGVANLGVDSDVLATQSHMAEAEAKLNKTWTLPADFEWKNLPHVDAEFKL